MMSVQSSLVMVPINEFGNEATKQKVLPKPRQWAKDDEGSIRGFILEKGAKGLWAPAVHGKVGLKASITGEIVLGEVFCPEENAFPMFAV